MRRGEMMKLEYKNQFHVMFGHSHSDGQDWLQITVYYSTLRGYWIKALKIAHTV